MSTLLTSGQAGQLVGLSARQVGRLADQGVIQVAQKLPTGARLFELDEVQRFAAERLLGTLPNGHIQPTLDEVAGGPKDD